MVYPIARTATEMTLQAGREVWAVAANRIAARGRDDLVATITAAIAAAPPEKQTLRVTFAADDADAVLALARSDAGDPAP